MKHRPKTASQMKVNLSNTEVMIGDVLYLRVKQFVLSSMLNV